MDLCSKKTIQTLLQQIGAHPTKKLGQNFLIDQTALEKIVKAAQINKNDVILEIGPGIGNLTQELVKEAKQVIAVEKDHKMVEILGQALGGAKNLKVIEDDALKKSTIIKNLKLKIINYKIVANLPYYAALAIIMKFLETENQPNLMVVTVQKEVADKICSEEKAGLSSMAIKFFGQPEVVAYIPKNSFWPCPKVDSAILKISAIQKRPDQEFNKKFFKILKAGFSHPRKTILNNLSERLGLAKEETKKWLELSGVFSQKRPENLKLIDWVALVDNWRF